MKSNTTTMHFVDSFFCKTAKSEKGIILRVGLNQLEKDIAEAKALGRIYKGKNDDYIDWFLMPVKNPKLNDPKARTHYVTLLPGTIDRQATTKPVSKKKGSK